MDVVGSLYLAASVTSRLRLGTAVTNLVTRHPAVVASTFATLHHVTGGRAHIGVGRGDTALELVGIRPPSAHEFEEQIGRLQTYLRGEVVDVEGFGSGRTRRRSTSWCAATPASPPTSSGFRGRRCRRATPPSWPM
jgi:5,10-methylenetetrahydromethanopterin reductase